MVINEIAEIFAPMQILLVMVIALIVFGPKRLPELGKSIGGALRDLNRAKNDMMRSFSLEHEPEHQPYRYDEHTADQSSNTNYNSSHDYGYNYHSTPEQPDLSDYTIAGVPPKDIPAIEGTVARGSHDHYGSNGYDPAASADYNIVSYKPAASTGGSANADTSAVDAQPKGEHNA